LVWVVLLWVVLLWRRRSCEPQSVTITIVDSD